MARAYISAAMLVLGTACSADMNLYEADSAAGERDSDALSDDTSQTDTAVMDATWFGVDALVTVDANQVAGVIVTHKLYAEDPSEGIVCTSERTATEIIVLDETPDEIVWHWVEVATDGDDGGCEASSVLPQRLRLGLGGLYPDVTPGVVDAGLQAENMYGAYASLDAPAGDGIEGTTYAYGYAGSPANRGGEALAETEGPLADGAYIVTAWYLFRL